MTKKICLDAGHYGKYNPSPVVAGYYESDMNWKLHLLLKAELEKYGFEVGTTRADKDTDLGLVERGRLGDGYDLLLSIHSNAVGSGANEEVDYPVVYIPLNGSGTEIGWKLAKCIASVMGTRQEGRAETRKGSGNWDYYSVIYGAVSVGVPGLILEHSFHTNTRSTKWLMDDSNLDKMAKAEAEVIANHFGVVKPQKPTEDPKQMYRIRKNWEDAESQVGAYSILENAINACPDGYTVYDNNGTAVHMKNSVAAKGVELPLLKKGSKGASVTSLQILLIGFGFSCGSCGADGDFGKGTYAALVNYQNAKGLDADGVCGPKTWAMLLGV